MASLAHTFRVFSKFDKEIYIREMQLLKKKLNRISS